MAVWFLWGYLIVKEKINYNVKFPIKFQLTSSIRVVTE